ncbi:unnamed protein product [Lactuca saligna]|uniref:Glutaredoxin domain-containing protein n=1 Tax=Lactuca saligna TaxID=75948 RepID=A0AA35ZAN4_LACSI|nr:unnamed protein product [Lactuca saligna]
MGCASSHLLNHDEDFSQIGSSALGHHIVSLTSTTYGLLTLDPSSTKPTVSPTPPPRVTLLSIFPTAVSESRSEAPPEVINSWELMAGLDSTIESFRLYSQPSKRHTLIDKENSNPNKTPSSQENCNQDHQNPIFIKPTVAKTSFLYEFEELCPPRGENMVVVYTTTLRGVRKTFEECNAVRAVIEGHGVFVCERDISMDQGFREELRELMKGKDKSELVPPRVFVKGRYVGGANEVLKTLEEGSLGLLLEGLPKSKAGYVCEGCGGVRFLPCFSCNGSCKMTMDWRKEGGKRAVVRCGECNENGLVHCPICS